MQTGEGTTEGRRLPSPAMLLAVAALIAALAGTAIAVDRITSKDIAKNAVRSKHIKAGQVRTSDANLVKHMRAAPEVTHASPAAAGLGPSITVKAARGDILRVNARVTIRALNPGDCFVNAALDGPGDAVDAELRAMTRSGGPSVTYADNENSGTGVGLNSHAFELPVVNAGRHRVYLTYQAEIGTVCGFADRNLWVELVR